MNIKRIAPIILMAILLLVLVINVRSKHNTNDKLNTLKKPNEINLYNNGEQKKILKNTQKGSQDVYDDICELIIFQMPEVIGVGNSDIISNTEMNEIKECAVEFIYNKAQKIKVNYSGNVKKVKYTELLFPMSEKYEDEVYMKTQDNTYLFIGVRPNIKYLFKNMF